jgi:flagellar biosynthesis protein FlhF
MQIKSFTAHSTKQVLAEIKAELGPDAVILDTQEEDGLITMTAALEREPSRRPPPSGRPDVPFADAAGEGRPPGIPADRSGGDTHAPPGPAARHPQTRRGRAHNAGGIREHAEGARAAKAATGQGRGAAFAPADGGPPRPARNPSGDSGRRPDTSPDTADFLSSRAAGQAHAARRADASGQAFASSSRSRVPEPADPRQWQDEWTDIKQQLMAIMKPAASLDSLTPRQRLAVEFLRREGVEEAALHQLRSSLHGDPATPILVPLGGLVPVCSWSSDNWPQRIQVIAGPFGAGKTTVAVRLALTLRRIRPGIRLCLLNADATRGNGRLLLRHYCDLSDMAYKEASTTMELVAALNQGLREGFERIIVDLPGIVRGRCLRTLLDDSGLSRLTGDGPEGLAVHLALSPHYREMHGIMERYRTAHRSGIIWTKLDEAERFGQVINVGAATGLPVSALSFGPGLGNSLAPAKENMLWRLIFKREMPSGS